MNDERHEYFLALVCALIACVAGCSACSPNANSARSGTVIYPGQNREAKIRIAQVSSLKTIEDCNERLKLNPNDVAGLRRRAQLRAQSNDSLGSIADLDRLISLSSSDSWAYERRGWQWGLLHNDVKCESDYSEAIRLDQRNANLYCLRASLRDKMCKRKEALQDFDKTLDIQPKNYYALGCRGRLRAMLGNEQGAIKDLDQEIQIKPSPFAYFWRAKARIFLGEKINAAEHDFDCAKKLDPTHALFYHYRMLPADLTLKSAAFYTVTAQDLIHGEQQLRRMLNDRRDMVNYVRSGDSIWTWTVRQFAGEGLGTRVFWSKENPTSGGLWAQHFGPQSKGATGEIRVREFDKEIKADGEFEWSSAIFELLNIRNTEKFNKIARGARSGTLAKAEFFREESIIEFKVGLQQTLFYRTMWLPHAVKNEISATPSNWQDNEVDTYEEWSSKLDGQSTYERAYGKDYDQMRIDFSRLHNTTF